MRSGSYTSATKKELKIQLFFYLFSPIFACVYDIDIFSFRKNILLPLLKDYNLYFGKKESSDDINVQKGLLFNRDTYIIVLDKDEGFSKTIELVRSEFEVIAPRRAVTIQHKECYIYCIESGCTGCLLYTSPSPRDS